MTDLRDSIRQIIELLECAADYSDDLQDSSYRDCYWGALDDAKDQINLLLHDAEDITEKL